MTETDGTRDGRVPGGATPDGDGPSTWNRPTWASLSGDGDGPAPSGQGGTPAAGTAAAPMPTRRQIRTGAIPVVPAPTATPAAPVSAAAPTAPVSAPTAPVAATQAASATPGDGSRAGWTHPNLVGRDGGDAPGPSPTAAPGGMAAPGSAAGFGTPAAGSVPTSGSVPASGVPAPGTPAGPVPGDDSGAGGSGGGTPDDGTDDEPRRRRWPLVVAVVAAVVVVGGGVTAYALTRDDAPPAAAPADVVLPSPTATVEPAARPATSAFATALPATVLQYALASSADDAAWLGQGAIEAYTETYTDGGAGQVTVQAGQWETPEEADAVLEGLAAALPAAPDADADADASTATASATAGAGSTGPAVLSSGEVTVDGTAVGTVTVVDAGDGTGVALWRNGSAVFLVTGPAADIANLYAAYPL